MNNNFSIRFQIIRENQESTMPGIFNNNTIIEMSGLPLNTTSQRINPFFVFDSMVSGNSFEISSTFPSIVMNNLFDMISTEQSDDIMEMFLNQSLQQDQYQIEKATPDMIKGLGSYRRIKENDSLLHEECVICSDIYQKDEGIRELPTCNHVFHKKCIDRWFKEGSVFCPICRNNPFDSQPTENKQNIDSQPTENKKSLDS